MKFIDPRPLLEELYRYELAELEKRLGEPRTSWDRRRFALERWRLRRHIFGTLPRTINW
jgi:hypothetical protein